MTSYGDEFNTLKYFVTALNSEKIRLVLNITGMS